MIHGDFRPYEIREHLEGVAARMNMDEPALFDDEPQTAALLGLLVEEGIAVRLTMIDEDGSVLHLHMVNKPIEAEEFDA